VWNLRVFVFPVRHVWSFSGRMATGGLVARQVVFLALGGGAVAGGTADSGSDVDVVDRALAILDEEWRVWLTWQRDLAEQAERGPDAR
jgi:S-adenosylmethionine synthetase